MRFRNNIGSSIPWAVHTDRDYSSYVAPIGSYFFLPGFKTSLVPQTESYWIYNDNTGNVVSLLFSSPEEGYEIADCRGFLDLGDGHYVLALRLIESELLSASGAIIESRDYGKTWVARYSLSVGWHDYLSGVAIDIRDLRLGNDGSVYGAMSIDDGTAGILRFNSDETGPPEWCLFEGPFESGYKNYGICQDSLNRWYMYCVRISGAEIVRITRGEFIPASTEIDIQVWQSTPTELDNDSYHGFQRYIRKISYSSYTDQIWIPTNDGIFVYDVGSDTSEEYLISTDFNTNFTCEDSQVIKLDSTGNPDWLAGWVYNPSYEILVYSLLKRRSGNIFDCYLFDEPSVPLI